MADLVLHHGEARFAYACQLGALSPGPHRLEVALHSTLGEGAEVTLSGYAVEVAETGSRRHAALAQAPILVGREGDPLNDTPLMMVAEPVAVGYRYTMIFSHEDGGTPGPKLMSRWGRRTDIEWVYEGDGATGWYQATLHRRKVFDGARRGSHPLLEVASKNNNFAPLGADPHRAQARPVFAPVPVVLDGPMTSRERAMDEHPWITSISQLELEREGIEAPADPATPAVSDLRGYLYLECHLSRSAADRQPRADDPLFWKGAHLVFEATLADGTAVRSDHGESPKAYGLYRHGWARTTIELPEGVAATEVVALTAQWRGRGIRPAPTLLSVRAFSLGPDFAPGPDLFRWGGVEPGANGHNLAIPPARGAGDRFSLAPMPR